jgi:RNA polymerase sigma factor (TIGR02999 family)
MNCVNCEAYLRLVGGDEQHWSGRGHFFTAAAEAMRRILVENARRKQSLRRGGDRKRISIDNADLALEKTSDEIIALDEALTKLAKEDSVKADLVKLRYFTGLSFEQASEVLKISRATAYRYWSYAQAWLFDKINKGDL